MAEETEIELKRKLRNWVKEYGLYASAKANKMTPHYVRMAQLDPRKYLDQTEKLIQYFKGLDKKKDKRLAELI